MSQSSLPPRFRRRDIVGRLPHPGRAQNWERLCQKANDIIGEGEIANDSGREDLKSFAPENAVFNNGADLKTNLSFALNAYNALKVNFHASGLHSTGSEAEDALLGDLDEDQLM